MNNECGIHNMNNKTLSIYTKKSQILIINNSQSSAQHLCFKKIIQLRFPVVEDRILYQFASYWQHLLNKNNK